MNTRLLAAADGSADSVGALRTAGWLTSREADDVAVLTVLEQVGMFDITFSPPLPVLREDLQCRQEEALRGVVLDQLRALASPIPNKAVLVESGPPAATIVRTAHRMGASLIVPGIGRHARLDRLSGREVALEVARLAHVPVLAVPRDITALPSRVLVGVDFSSFARATLRALPDVIAPGAEVHLAHVIQLPRDEPDISPRLYASHAPKVRRAMEDLAMELFIAHGIPSVVHVLKGHPARSLLQLAKQLDADLVSTGSHGHGFWGRLVLGSVSTRVIRAAQHAVLIVPPSTRPVELLDDPVPAQSPPFS